MKIISFHEVDAQAKNNNGKCIVCGNKIKRVHATYICTNCGFSTEYSDL